VTRASLVCGALLAAAPQALTHSELLGELDAMLAYLRATGCEATFDLDKGADDLLQAGLSPLLDSGVVHCFDAGIEPVYNVTEERALDAAYYRNNAIHCLYLGALADLALARLYLDGVGPDSLAELEAEVLRLRKLFQWEFFFPERDEFLARLYADLDIRQPGWRALVESGKDGLHELFRTLTPLLGHSALESYLESYRIVAEQLRESGQAESFDQKAFIGDCLNIGRQLLLQRQVVSAESIAKAMFDTGLKVAKSRGLLDISLSAAELERRRGQHAEEMRAINRRVRALRSLASARRAGVIS
jgi:glycerol-3-phosphate O-acyltransferase